MDDLRTRIAARKRARRKRALIRLAAFAAVIAAIIIIAVSCNKQKPAPLPQNNITDVSPSPVPDVENSTQE